MNAPDRVARGRESFERQAWRATYDELSAADRSARLEPEDVERLATAAHLLGLDTDSADLLARAYHDHLDRGAVERAARCAFWLAFGLLFRGETARGSGWLARAEKLLAQQGDCVERGFLLVPAAYQSWDDGDPATGHATFVEAGGIGEHFRNPDLTTLANLGRGQTLIALAQTTAGIAALDEAMVAVTAGEVSPVVVGLVYCAVIDACKQVFDLRRAHEWTAALSQWCAGQPDLVPYRGQCLVHRAEIMQLHGAWAEAMTEARRARDRLLDPPGQAAVGMACYQLAELHRLRGEWTDAEEAYRQAGHHGHSPQPGQALLRLAQGHLDAALGTIRRVTDELDDPISRAHMLPAAVEVMIAASDVAAARAAANELSALAADLTAPPLDAASAYANGAVTLAEGDARSALGLLRRAWKAWRQLDAPYELARTRVLLGLVCHELGDEDGAVSELDSARQTFQLLGAKPDLDKLERLSGQSLPVAGGLTAREVQVLALVVEGRTNRQIAAQLVISEHTVRRHLQNVFGKLDVSSRAAATAYALRHHLV